MSMGPDSFDNRLKIGTSFEDQLFAALAEFGFLVARNGSEHTCPEFTNRLRSSNDQTSLAVRFQPDGVIGVGKTPQTIFVEAKTTNKSTPSIEKHAYEQYLKLASIGNLVIVVFNCHKDWLWNFVEAIKLIPGSKTVECFPRPFPVENDWIYPRHSGRTVKGGSGTPYREVNKETLCSWSQFYQTVCQLLVDRDCTSREKRILMTQLHRIGWNCEKIAVTLATSLPVVTRLVKESDGR